jgi:ubiquinone biosynthesis monooxygenase Coq7
MQTLVDQLISDADNALRTLTGALPARRPTPQPSTVEEEPGALLEGERRHAAALMRVDHVGEVCAQALYHGQARAAQSDRLRAHFRDAALEEGDHLAWTRERLAELGGRPSLLNPLWYAGAFALGVLAGRAGDRVSLGFVMETEAQVEQHLKSHLERLPKADHASRAVLEAMSEDEARHGSRARAEGGRELPAPVRAAMRAAARVMTATAYWL